jgi:excisionase family DNA binding protein
MSDAPRFLTLADVAEVLNTSLAQVTALVHRRELKALKLGGRGQWRVEATELEDFIARMYEQTDRHLAQQRTASRMESADVEI